LAGYQTEERTKRRKALVDHAIQLAMQNRWADAVQVNRSIIELFPNDADAYNRLGRALREQGKYKEARDAYARAVEIDPNNSIAQKNLASLANLDVEAAPSDGSEKVDARLFIAESGKSGPATLVAVRDRALVAKMAVGDQVYLAPEGRALYARNARGETLGQVEPKVAQRLIDLMNGGNKYAAALMSVEEGAPRIIIHEVFQHPSQVGKVSFPTRGDAAAAVRPYTKESLLKYADYDEEDEDAELDHEMMSETDGEVEEPLETAEFGDEDTPE
jgi:hypothetical protein